MKSGSLLGGVLLITGSCVGAGMLALPILSGLAGFFPSVTMFLCAWAFMTATGLLMVEVNGWFKGRANIISMAGHSLGKWGRFLGWTLYLFLFYSLLVAYISAVGSLASTYLETYFSWKAPSWFGSFFFVLLFGTVAYLGTRTVDHWNRVLMVGKIMCYVLMVVIGFDYLQPHLLARSEASFAFFSLPALIVAFGYHNMIPTLTSYMQGDLKKVRLTILIGSLFALVIYLIWNLVVLGIVPAEGEWGLIQSWRLGRQASDAVTGIVGVSWLSQFAEGLALFSLLTSFMAQTLALVHFLADGFKVQREKQESISLCMLALLPPLLCSLIYPQLFILALNFAGGICAVILFGILPVLMVWTGRYIKKVPSPYQVFGGRPLLVAVFLFAIFILFFQISSMFDASYIPNP
jgi:tyrosine-specific transport protein